MRIEIDTKSDSREELRHLANMLMALSNSSSNNVIVKQRNIFDDPSPGVGMMGMFSDSSPQPSASEPQPASFPSLFSIFSDSPKSGQSQPSLDVIDEDDGKRTSAEDVLDDDRIVPYS